MANESERSKVILFDPNAKTEEFKRSSHNDFATTSELRQRKFSGWRENKLTAEYELWLTGTIEARVGFIAAANDPTLLERVHKKVFALD